MASVAPAAQDATDLAVLRQEARDKDEDIAARYEYAPHDAMLEPLQRLPRDRGFLASYSAPGAASVHDFMHRGAKFPLTAHHATAFLATLSVRQVLLAAIDKMPETYFFGPDAITPAILRSIAAHVKNRERVEDPALHTLVRQFVFSATDLDQYDRILLLLRVESTKRRGSGEVKRRRSAAQWKELEEEYTDKAYEELGVDRKTAVVQQNVAFQEANDHSPKVTDEMRAKAMERFASFERAFSAVKVLVQGRMETAREQERVDVANSAKENLVGGRSEGWALFCFHNYANDQGGRSVDTVTAIQDGIPVPETDEDAEALGLSVSVEAARRVLYFFSGTSRAYYSPSSVPSFASFQKEGYPLGREVMAASPDSLALLLEYATLLSRSHKKFEEPYANSLEEAVKTPANAEAMRASIDMTLYSRRFQETQFDDWIEPYGRTLADVNAKPFAPPRLAPLDFLARRAGQLSPAFAEKLAKAAAEYERRREAPAPPANAVGAAASSQVSLSKGPTAPPIDISYETEHDVDLIPFSRALGGLFGQRWSNAYPVKAGYAKLIEDWKGAAEPPRAAELCSAFPFFALLPPPSMLLDDDVVALLRADSDRLDAIEAYVRRHEKEVGNDVTRPIMERAWAAVSDYVSQLRRPPSAGTRIAAALHVKRLSEFVEEREIAANLAPSAAVDQLNDRRFQMDADDKKTLWELAKSALTNDYVRANTHAQQYEAELVGLRAMLKEAGEVRKTAGAELAAALLYSSFAYPVQQGYEAMKKTFKSVVTGNRNPSLDFDIAWGKTLKNSEVVKAVSAAKQRALRDDPGFVNEFEANVSFSIGTLLGPLRAEAARVIASLPSAEKVAKKDQVDILAPLVAFIGSMKDDARASIGRAGSLALRSVARTVTVRTLAELSRKTVNEATPVLVLSEDMLPSSAQFGAVERVLSNRQVPLEVALLGGKSEELREAEERLEAASKRGDATQIADAKADLDRFKQRRQREVQVKVEALAEAAFARAQRRGRIVNIYALTPALSRRFLCARQYWLFNEIFALVERDASFWIAFPYSQKDVADARQAFARLAALPLSEWARKDADEAARLLNEDPEDESKEVTTDAPIITDAGRAIQQADKVLRPNGLQGGKATFLAYGRAHYSSLKAFLDVLRELLDDVSLVEQDQHSTVAVAIEDAMADVEQQIRSLDETQQQITETDDFSAESFALQIKLRQIRMMLRDRYYYDVAPKTGSEPASIEGSLRQAAYGMFDPSRPILTDGVAARPWGGAGCALVRLFSGALSHASGTVEADISIFVDHSGYLDPDRQRHLLLRDFLTGTLLAGGVTQGAGGYWAAEKADRESFDFSSAQTEVANELLGRSGESAAKALKAAGDSHKSWTKPLSDVVRLALIGALASGREEEVAEAMRTALAERALAVEDLAEQLHRRVPGLEDANMYRASAVLVLARKRQDRSVALTCASIGDSSLFALTYPLVTDARNVSRASASMRELRADALASADAYARVIDSARAIAAAEGDSEQARVMAASLHAILSRDTVFNPGPTETVENMLARLESVGPNSKDAFAKGKTYLDLFRDLVEFVSRFELPAARFSTRPHQWSIASRGAVSDALSAGEFFSPEAARATLAEKEEAVKTAADKADARLAVARYTAIVDYVNEIVSDSLVGDTIRARREAGGLISEQLRDLRRGYDANRLQDLVAFASNRELRAWIEYGIAIRSNTLAPIGTENELFVRRAIEKEREQSAQTATAAIASLTAAKRRLTAWTWGGDRVRKATVAPFFHLRTVEGGARMNGRQRAYTLALAEQIVREGGEKGFAAPKFSPDGKSIVSETATVEQARSIVESLSARTSAARHWVVSFSSDTTLTVTDSADLELMLAMQNKMLAAFETPSASQVLPVLRALRGLGASGDDADARFPLPLPIATPNSVRDAEGYREHVLVDKNTIGRVELIPADLFLRPFSLVHYAKIKGRADSLRASLYSSDESEDDLYEDYFSRVKLVCGVERSPFAIGNLWLKRKSCAATFEQIRAYAEANGSGSDYADYLAGLYVSDDSRLLPIVPRDPAQLVRASAYELSTADRAYFFVSGNYFRFVGLDSFAREARKAARHLEARVSLMALSEIVSSAKTSESARQRLALLKTSVARQSAVDQLAASLGSQEAAEQIRAVLLPGKVDEADVERALDGYSRLYLGTDDEAELGSAFVDRLRLLFDRHQESFLRDVIQKDAKLEDGHLMDISEQRKLEAMQSRLNSEFGVAYFGPFSNPAAYLAPAAAEIGRKLMHPRLVEPDFVLTADPKGFTRTTSKFVRTRSRFLLSK